MKDYTEKTIWIIGAGSGIGASLAKNLALKGASIILSGRDAGKLAIVQAAMKGKHSIHPCDVIDREQVERVVDAIFNDYPKLDSVIFFAALYEPSYIESLSADTVQHIMNVNVVGAFNVVGAVLPRLKHQQGGQIALCGSVAGYRGLPKGQPYSASKAAIMNFAQSLRCEMIGKGIDVKLISPGFVKTSLTDKNDFKMPMMIGADEAADHISRGLLTSKFEISFPFVFTAMMKAIRLMPDWLYFRVFRA